MERGESRCLPWCSYSSKPTVIGPRRMSGLDKVNVVTVINVSTKTNIIGPH